MQVELVSATTSDGLRLDGALKEPSAGRSSGDQPDAFLLLHGVGGTFYGGSMFGALMPVLLDHGGAVLRVATRGSGSVTMFASDGGATRGGAAFEVVDQCRYDIDAWCDLLLTRGYSRIALIGHSLGAIKAIYSAAYQPHPNVTHVIAASPPRLSHSAFQHDERSSAFFESMQTAQKHVADGKPETLFTARFPFPLLIAAASYVDKYGPQERYNILRFADRVTVPTLFVYGQRELDTGGTAFAGLPAALRKLTADKGQFDIDVIPGADHFYTGCYEKLFTRITNWI